MPRPASAAPARSRGDAPATKRARPAAQRQGSKPAPRPAARRKTSKPAPRPAAPAKRAAELPAPQAPSSPFRQRYGVVHNTQGPRVRLGVLWAVAAIGALAIEPLRPYGFATIYGVVAGAAALQVVDAWYEVRSGADRWVAALGASTLPVVATLGVRPIGAALLALAAAALITAALAEKREMPLLAAAGHTVFAAGACGGAAASLVLLADYEIGAVIILPAFLMVYDASDFAVGSGASNGGEGPLAGALAIAAVSSFVAVTEVPPFRGADIWSVAMLAAVACPAGQSVASAMLPRADADAPALRRLDSALVVGPAWAGVIGLYLQHAGG